MQTEIWTYAIELPADIDLVGFHVDATDGSIGKIDEASNEVGASRLVVDTGPWILGRKVVIPASHISAIDIEGERVAVGLTKDQIKDSPELSEDEREDDPVYFERVGHYYDAMPHSH